MASSDPGGSGSLAQKPLDELTFQLWRKAPLVSYDKILFPLQGTMILSSLLYILPSFWGALQYRT